MAKLCELAIPAEASTLRLAWLGVTPTTWRPAPSQIRAPIAAMVVLPAPAAALITLTRCVDVSAWNSAAAWSRRSPDPVRVALAASRGPGERCV